MADEFDDIISDVIKAEGGAIATNDPNDRGGRTQYGISERSNPQAWLDGKVTEAEAREIYLQKYVVGPGFQLISCTPSPLQKQLIDYGVNSGPMLAIQKVQTILGGLDVDGVLGPLTLQAISAADQRELNNKLVVERVRMIIRVVKRDASQMKFLEGLVNRALSFLI